MNTMHPLTLTFRDAALEKHFLSATYPRTRLQGQTAMIVGMVVYMLCGLLDHWFVPAHLAEEIWNIRFIALCVPLFVLVLTFTPFFEPYSHFLLACVGLAAGVGLLFIQMLLPVQSTFYYYPMMALVTFYTYNFIGTRFIYALCVDLSLFTSYNIVFGVIMEYPFPILAAHDAILVSANLIGGTAGYLAERQRRLLFVRECELDQERHLQMQRALHDPLTGLPNRDLLYDRLDQMILLAKRDDNVHCGFFLDLDGFKAINDTLGHRTGDTVLKHVARRLSSAIREIDTIARIGGDEFFIIAMNVGNEESASRMAQKLLDTLLEPIPGIPEEFSLSVSIGICLFPYEGMSTTDIIHRSDKAMYRVKCSGKGTYSFARQTPPVQELQPYQST